MHEESKFISHRSAGREAQATEPASGKVSYVMADDRVSEHVQQGQQECCAHFYSSPGSREPTRDTDEPTQDADEPTRDTDEPIHDSITSQLLHLRDQASNTGIWETH